jgi:hypothetical protein
LWLPADFVAKPGKIRPSPLKDLPSIHAIERESGHIRFSFKHLALGHPDFNVGDLDSNYFSVLLEKLKEMSRFRAAELRGSHSRSVRCHPITWPETSQPGGFTHLNEQLRDMDAWQFQIETNNYGRIHGIFIDDVFFIVWLDPNHRLYPGR